MIACLLCAFSFDSSLMAQSYMASGDAALVLKQEATQLQSNPTHVEGYQGDSADLYITSMIKVNYAKRLTAALKTRSVSDAIAAVSPKLANYYSSNSKLPSSVDVNALFEEVNQLLRN